MGPDGEPRFYDLMFRRRQPVYTPSDLLWLDSVELRELPLLERKRRLRRVAPNRASRLLYVQHVRRRGCDLFNVICERNMEGVVGKLAQAPYPSTRRPG